MLGSVSLDDVLPSFITVPLLLATELVCDLLSSSGPLTAGSWMFESTLFEFLPPSIFKPSKHKLGTTFGV